MPEPEETVAAELPAPEFSPLPQTQIPIGPILEADVRMVFSGSSIFNAD
jgi:hypothetical protein